MIVKNLTRTSATSLKQLFKYVFNPDKQNPDGKILSSQLWTSRFNENDYFWSALQCGVHLSNNELAQLRSETVDSELLLEYARYGTDKPIAQFVQDRLIPKEIAIKHGVKSTSIDGMVKEYRDVEVSRIRKSNTDVAAHHTILAFDHLDSKSISDAILLDLTQKYIELRGTDQLYAGAIHRDKHPHVHLIMSATSLSSGRAARVSKQEFQKIKIQLQQYQQEKYPELNSLPKHTLEGQKNLKIDRTQPLRQVTASVLSKHAAEAKSTEHFIELLRNDGFEVYHRSGKLAGVITNNGMKQRFSRSGVDLAALVAKDAKLERAQKVLDEFSAIRSGRQSTKEKVPLEGSQDKIVQLSEQEQAELNNMQAIRSSPDSIEVERASKDEDTPKETEENDKENDTEQKSSQIEHGDEDKSSENIREEQENERDDDDRER